jgi:succinate dehydrogenase/fumarate reductase flavoprotein subunit
MQVRSLLVVLEASARSALMRKESRGVHYRSDYPETDNNHWLREIVVRQVGGRMTLKPSPVVVTKTRLPRGKFGFEEGILNAVKALGG